MALEHDAKLAARAGDAGPAFAAGGTSATGAGPATQPQNVQPVQERLEQWINTLTSPLPH